MKMKIIIILIASMCVIVSSWSYSIFKKLKNVVPYYKANKDTYPLSSDYLNLAEKISKILLTMSIITFIFCTVYSLY